MRIVWMLLCLTLILVSGIGVSVITNDKQGGEVDIDLAVNRAMREETKEKQILTRKQKGKQSRKFKNKSKKGKRNKPKGKIKITKRIKQLINIKQKQNNKKTKTMEKERKPRTDQYKIASDIFDYIKLYSIYQNALRKGKQIVRFFKILKSKEVKARTLFQNASKALNSATANGTKCGTAPPNQEAVRAASGLRNCSVSAAESCKSAGITSIKNTIDCSSCDASCSFEGCITATCVSNCINETKENTLDDQAVAEFEKNCVDNLDRWTSRFKVCIFTKTFKKCSVKCLTDSDRLKCNLYECRNTNCKEDCSDCPACSHESCLVGCGPNQTCITKCKFQCLQALGTVDNACKFFAKNFETATRTRRQGCTSPTENFRKCKAWAQVVPYYTMKCSTHSVCTKAPSRRSQYQSRLRDFRKFDAFKN